LKRKNPGFTLIELVIVITIIGILAAMALPRFAAVQTEARIAKMNGALGAMKSAAAMAHAQLLSSNYASSFSGNPASPDINIEGVDVRYKFGYPDSQDIAALAGAVTPDFILDQSGTQLAIYPDSNHASCRIIYHEATGVLPTGVTPQYDITGLSQSNCS